LGGSYNPRIASVVCLRWEGAQALGYTASVVPVLPLPLTTSNEKLGGAWEHGKDTQKKSIGNRGSYKH